MAVSEKNLIIKKSRLPNAGQGLFTLVDIAKGERIVEYKGRYEKWNDVKHEDGYNGYLLRVNKSVTINALPSRAKGRYANDAAGLSRLKGVRNNSEYLTYGKKCFIVATRNLRKGEEILVSYGSAFWNLQRKLADL